MQVIRKINNNCVLALDSSGAEVVAFGKGLGFKHTPYELDDLGRVERTFYGIDRASVSALKDIPSEVVEVASDVIEYAGDLLGVDLNPNAPVTLADHLAFAMRRTEQGVVIESPLAFDVRRFYPREFKIGSRAVTLVKSRLGVELPEAEKTNIALHVIDSETTQPDMTRTKRAAEVIADVTAIVEEALSVKVDTDSFAYQRFVTHVRFLVDRIYSGEAAGTDDLPMLEEMKGSYPLEAGCVRKIVGHLSERWGWTCGPSEELYLLLHVHQLRGRIG